MDGRWIMRRLNASTVALGFAALLFAPFGAFAGDDAIGMVKASSGHAFIISGNAWRNAAVGALIRRHDRLETGVDGAVGVTFRDDTRLSLGPHSQLKLSTYQFQPRQRHFAFVATLMRGSMMYVSGLIAKRAPEAVAVVTPVGTIGVDGTRLLVDIAP
jgi:hypothetical protein